MSDYDARDISIPVIDITHDTLMPCDPDAKRVRTLNFSSREHEIVINVTDESTTVSLSIDVTPRGSLAIDVRPLHGASRRVWSDADGHSSCTAVPLGPMSLVVHWPPSAGGPARTAWAQL